MSHNDKHIIMEELTDPHEVEGAREQHARFQRNARWLQAHIAEFAAHRGKFICVAGEEAFVGDTVDEAIALAKAAHPDDNGAFTQFIPLERLPRIYAI